MQRNDARRGSPVGRVHDRIVGAIGEPVECERNGFLKTHARLPQVCSATRELIGNRSRRRRTPRFASPAGATAVPGTQP